MDKKIAIVTWYTNGNHGGTLQAFALQKVLESMGVESEFVDFCPRKKSLRYIVERTIKDIIIYLYKPKVYKTRKSIYKFVKEKLNVSKPYYSYDDLRDEAKERYSAAICGSDQIWCNAGYIIDELYYLTFIEKDKRIAYAPSTGPNYMSDSFKGRFIECIKDIKFLSVREKQGSEFIKKVTGFNAKVVLDPTLLLTKAQWEEKFLPSIQSLEKPKEKFIFCYFLGCNPEHARYAYSLSKETGYKIITLDMKKCAFKNVEKRVVDPFGFLDLIYNAVYVLTDSFHGTALSIVLEKQFAVFKRFKDTDPNNQNSRIFNILEKTRLEDRLISCDSSTDILVKNSIDYTLVNELLNVERRESLEYLKEALDSVLNKNE